MAAGLDFQLSFRAAGLKKRGASDIFHLLVMGDFSGRRPRSRSLAARTPVRVDVDNFDTLLRTLAPRLCLKLGDGTEVVLEFSRLEDFHADALYGRLPLFRKARELRARLMNPATFTEAVAALQPASQGGAVESDGDALERLLGTASPAQTDSVTVGTVSVVDKLLRQAVGSDAIAAPPLQRDVYVQALDAGSSESLRTLLHHPEFQALEAAWLGLHGLVSSLGGDEEIHLAFLDVGEEELRVDRVACGGDPAKSALWSQVVEGGVGAPGGAPWSALACLRAFGPTGDDPELLAFLGSVAAGAGAAFLAGASPSVLGISALEGHGDSHDWPGLTGEVARRWQALRRSALAPWIGLALPRVLLRLPYGKQGEPVAAFPFEEMGAGFRHESCLWGSPATILGQLLGQAFLESGADMEAGEVLELDDLPAYVHDVDGERQLLPCAEVLLGERAAEGLLSLGLMPLLSHRDRNAVRLVRFQSIAEPGMALRGPWR